MNLIIVSSVINISTKALSYTKVRSVYSNEERFDQTLVTLDSIKKIPDVHIIHIEASIIPKDYENVIKAKSDTYVNLYSKDDSSLIEKIEGKHKSIAESVLIYEGIKSLDLTKYENIFKISGRYWLDEEFEYQKWDNDKTLFRTDGKSLSTCLYKINKKDIAVWEKTLLKGTTDKTMIETIFMKGMKDHFTAMNEQGLSGRVSVNGELIKY